MRSHFINLDLHTPGAVPSSSTSSNPHPFRTHHPSSSCATSEFAWPRHNKTYSRNASMWGNSNDSLVRPLHSCRACELELTGARHSRLAIQSPPSTRTTRAASYSSPSLTTHSSSASTSLPTPSAATTAATAAVPSSAFFRIRTTATSSMQSRPRSRNTRISSSSLSVMFSSSSSKSSRYACHLSRGRRASCSQQRSVGSRIHARELCCPPVCSVPNPRVSQLHTHVLFLATAHLRT